MPTSSLGLLLHTVRHLRPRQIASRVHYRLADRLARPASWQRRLQAARIGNCQWHPQAPFLPPEQQGNTEPTVAEGRFCFQNDERVVGRPVNWNPTEAPLLWRYNLHYFDYLWSLTFEAARDIALDWMENHPFKRGHVGWDPYPISLRILNWCAYFFGTQAERTQVDPVFLHEIRKSLAMQACRLSRRLEYHLLGNHLLENAAALTLVGLCFDGADAERYHRIGRRLLETELREQILGDGMHFERSPMYHARILHLVLILMNVAPDDDRSWLAAYAERMLEALKVTTHPDGRIALLNDSAFSVYPCLGELTEFARQLGVNNAPQRKDNETFSLTHAGYYGARTSQGHYLICDAGKVGPDYIPGHAHGDIFSFELSLFGDRVIVDSGVYDYVRGDMRRYCRSTAAHNTVELGGRDQCEFWDAFKVARRGRPHDVVFQETERGFSLAGWHDGYRRLPGAPTHRREFHWLHEGVLVLQDTVAPTGTPFVSRIHLHPACRALETAETSLTLQRGKRYYRVRAEGGRCQVASSWHCPEFGVRQESPVIEVLPRQGESTTRLWIAPEEKSDVDWFLVCGENVLPV